MHQNPQLIAQKITQAAQADPHWTAYLSALLVPVIAVFGAWIAYRQWRTAQNKLKLDLFDKRMAVYDAVREVLGFIASHGKITPGEQLKYMSGIRSAKWLFNQDVAEYLEKTLWGKIVDFELHETMSSGRSNNPERIKHVHARAETFRWLVKQYEVLDKKCSPFLSLRH